MGLYIGIDVGTSACRACAIDERGSIVAHARTGLPAPSRQGECVEQDAFVWWQGLTGTLDAPCMHFASDLDQRIQQTIRDAIAEQLTALTAGLQNRISGEIGPRVAAARERYEQLSALSNDLEQSLANLSQLSGES